MQTASKVTAEGVLKWGALAIIGIFVLPLLWKYLKAQAAGIKEQQQEIDLDNHQVEMNDPVQSQITADGITKRKDVQAAAAKIAHDLGTKYDTGSWSDIFNTSYWTENDRDVADTVVYQRLNFLLLEKLYYNIYTRKRNLKSDLLKYLDASDLARVRKYINI